MKSFGASVVKRRTFQNYWKKSYVSNHDREMGVMKTNTVVS